MSEERELLKRIANYGDAIPPHFIYEIKELLAQPEQTEQEPEAWILEDKKTGYRRQSAYKPTDLDEEACNVIPLYTAPPVKSEQTEQEPVATKLESHQFTAFHVSADDFKKLQKLPTGTKIYTAPPKREPLINIYVLNAFKADDEATHPYSYWAGVEFAEKHHGIGGGE